MIGGIIELANTTIMEGRKQVSTTWPYMFGPFSAMTVQSNSVHETSRTDNGATRTTSSLRILNQTPFLDYYKVVGGVRACQNSEFSLLLSVNPCLDLCCLLARSNVLNAFVVLLLLLLLLLLLE
jgi:hypothetical protein